MSAQSSAQVGPPSEELSKGSIMFDTDPIPWTNIGEDDETQFKLLRIDAETLGTTILFRMKKGAKVNTHRHFGAVELYTLSGSWEYVGDGKSSRDGYVYEHAGAVHYPVAHEDTLAFIVSRGPLQHYNEDGTPGVVIDAFSWYQMAEANNAVAHLKEHAVALGLR